MEKITLFSEIPESLGEFHLTSKEYCQYLYLPVKMAGVSDLVIEPRLEFLHDMVIAAIVDFSMKLGKTLIANYIYLTVKQTFIPKEMHHNRPGWHSDGFMTSDLQYIWYDSQPTEFMIGEFEVRRDDELSMEDLKTIEQEVIRQQMGLTHGLLGEFHQPEPFHLYRIDQNHIHRTTPATENGVRTFVKITISEQKYAQEGNSHNFQMDYDWSLSPRELTRNQPHISK